MRVHLVTWAPEILGGHRVQRDKTAEALKRLQLDVTVGEVEDQVPHNCDLLHIFGTPTEALVLAARRRGIPIVCSPVYWPLSYRFGKANLPARLRSTLGFAYRAARWGIARACLHTISGELRTALLFGSAHLLLPNSPGEAADIQQDLQLLAAMRLVPNATDPPSPASENNTRSIDVLAITRFEPHKNTLGLVRALRDKPLNVVIAGADHPHHPSYRARCTQAAKGSSIQILPALPHHELHKLYSSSKVHVLASWYETTGLVSLEAAAAGCQVVTTSRGHARYYFGNLAHYCEPGSPASIAAAVDRALMLPTKGLREHVLAHFTWEHAARATLRAYEQLLTASPSSCLDWPPVP